MIANKSKKQSRNWPKRIAIGFVGTLGSGAMAWCATTLWPWLKEQAGAWRNGEALTWPNDGVAFLALAGLFVVPILTFLAYFVVRVWQELEEDGKIYKDAATGVRNWGSAARNLWGRWSDRLQGSLQHWGFTRRYLRELPALRSIVDIRGLVQMEANRLELDDIYVELRAATRDSSHPLPFNPTTPNVRERAPVWDHLRYLPAGCALIIVGAPGSGKTTLLKHMLLTNARNRQWRYRARNHVPFFLELRKFPKAFGKTNDPDFPTNLRKVLETYTDLEPLFETAPEDWLVGLLKSGQCILLLDGLDEIPDLETRRHIGQWLGRQVNHPDWRHNLFIVTSRPAGYQSCQLQNARALEIQPFDFADIKRFIECWYFANEVVRSKATTSGKVIRQRADDNACKLLDRLRDHPRLGALTSNPLLLTMICLMHELGELPGSRSQLYEEICQVHLERWRRNRDVKETFNAAQKLTVLRPLAGHLMTQRTKDNTSDSKRVASRTPCPCRGPSASMTRLLSIASTFSSSIAPTRSNSYSRPSRWTGFKPILRRTFLPRSFSSSTYSVCVRMVTIT